MSYLKLVNNECVAKVKGKDNNKIVSIFFQLVEGYVDIAIVTEYTNMELYKITESSLTLANFSNLSNWIVCILVNGHTTEFRKREELESRCKMMDIPLDRRIVR